MKETEIYIHHLNNLLEQRRLRNTSYSLRALARDIGMDNAYLVHIINRNKKVTPKIAYKLATTLKLEGKDMLNFIIPSLQ